MNSNQKFQYIESQVRDFQKSRSQIIGVGSEGAVFSTSEETDVREMISDGLSVEEIISLIKRW